MITIREANINDCEILALLGRVTYSESHGQYIDNKSDLSAYNNSTFSIEQTEKDLKDSNFVYQLIYVDKLPVGYAKLILNIKNKAITKTNACCLDKIYILNDFIAMKIGYQLLNEVFEKAKELKFEYIWLSVYIQNERAISFYKKNSFVEVGTYTFVVNKKGYENVVLQKKLEV